MPDPILAPWAVPGTPPTDAAAIAAAEAAAIAAAELAASTQGATPMPQTPPAGDTAPAQGDAASEVYVTVTVPKAFTLRLDHLAEHKYKVGVQEMRLEHAEHWYAKANGVVVYKK